VFFFGIYNTCNKKEPLPCLTLKLTLFLSSENQPPYEKPGSNEKPLPSAAGKPAIPGL
jgi:hypothetical protein